MEFVLHGVTVPASLKIEIKKEMAAATANPGKKTTVKRKSNDVKHSITATGKQKRSHTRT